MMNADRSGTGLNRVAGVASALRDHWRLFLVEGIVLIVLGSAAIVVPPIASFAVAIFLGWLFLVGGIVGLVVTIAGRKAPGFWWALISAVVTTVAGGVLVWWPIGGVISLTFVLTVYLIADGMLTILFAFDHRRQLSQRWYWLLVNGILDLLLAGIIVWALPGSAIWALGLIVGVDLVFGGYSLVTMALAARAPKSA
ncbi:MAG: HdeD family acid-resistance protein [Rhizomicrobium sp.]